MLSEHLTWSNTGRFYLPDLLPIPYNEENLMAVVNNIDAAQNYLQRTLLIENPSSYFEYRTSCYSEAEFLAELVKRTGMHILLDVNNLYVSCFNHNWEPYQYIQTLPQKAIKEIHVAGHSVHIQDSNHMLLDTHDNYVCQEVWDLYRYVIRYIGVVPTLMEWDREIPALDILLNEAKSQPIMSMMKQIQNDFAKAIFNPNEIEFMKNIRESTIAPEFRLNIYRNNILQNLYRALEITFPAVWKLVGKECANNLAAIFVEKKNLPLTNCLDDWGANFPRFYKALSRLSILFICLI